MLVAIVVDRVIIREREREREREHAQSSMLLRRTDSNIRFLSVPEFHSEETTRHR